MARKPEKSLGRTLLLTAAYVTFVIALSVVLRVARDSAGSPSDARRPFIVIGLGQTLLLGFATWRRVRPHGLRDPSSVAPWFVVALAPIFAAYLTIPGRRSSSGEERAFDLEHPGWRNAFFVYALWLILVFGVQYLLIKRADDRNPNARPASFVSRGGRFTLAGYADHEEYEKREPSWWSEATVHTIGDAIKSARGYLSDHGPNAQVEVIAPTTRRNRARVVRVVTQQGVEVISPPE